MTEIKICGLTRPEDVALACELGARWLGFNFAAESPRRVELPRAKELAAAAATSGASRVGVFVRETFDEIRRAVEAASLDIVQIHRPLRAEDLEEIPRPVFAVVRVDAGAPLDLPSMPDLERCRAILFDTAVPSMDGGSGRAFDWSLLQGRPWPVPFFVAGGLTPENVRTAVERLRPAGVDVASGVEASAGVKDPDRMRRFFRAVKEADAH